MDYFYAIIDMQGDIVRFFETTDRERIPGACVGEMILNLDEPTYSLLKAVHGKPSRAKALLNDFQSRVDAALEFNKDCPLTENGN